MATTCPISLPRRPVSWERETGGCSLFSQATVPHLQQRPHLNHSLTHTSPETSPVIF